MTIKSKDEINTGQIEIDLSGPSGNAHCLLAMGNNFAKDLGLNWGEIRTEMTSSDYDNLIQVFDKYFGEYVILYR